MEIANREYYAPAVIPITTGALIYGFCSTSTRPGHRILSSEIPEDIAGSPSFDSRPRVDVLVRGSGLHDGQLRAGGNER